MNAHPSTPVAPPIVLKTRDWRAAGQSGWVFRDRRMRPDNAPPGQMKLAGKALRLADDQGGEAPGAEAVHTGPLNVSERFAITLRARFLKLGLDDDGTGQQSHFLLLLGAATPRGPFGLDFRFTADRYAIGTQSKVVRTDTTWHAWRFEVDTARKTVAMFRDGKYVCLHEAGTSQPEGVRLQVNGTATTPTEVEIGDLAIVSLPPETPAPPVTRGTTAPTAAPGEWPMWRRDTANTGFSPLRGKPGTPQVAWSLPVGGAASIPFFLDLDGDGQTEALDSRGGNLTALRRDGSQLWQQRLETAVVHGVYDLDGDGETELLVAAGVPSRLHVLRRRDGEIRYVSPHFPMAGVAGVRVGKLDPEKQGLQAVVWSHLHPIGYCLSFAEGIENARLDWTFDWKKTFFTPLTALADMDRDGRPELVVVTYNYIAVYNGRTGQVKQELEANLGRNYGTLVVKDVDNDDYPDICILADVLREHLGVVKNERGKSLRLLWDRFYEQNYPEDHLSMRVLTESVDDFDGDGQIEIAYSIFDDRTDSRWHTYLVDALTGKVRQDIPGTYLVAVAPLFPGRPPALVLSSPSSREQVHVELNAQSQSSQSLPFSSRRETRLSFWTGRNGQWAESAKLPAGTILARNTVREFAPSTWAQVSGIATSVPTRAVRFWNDSARRPGLYLLRAGGKAVEFISGNAAGQIETLWRVTLPARLPGGAVADLLSAAQPGAGPEIVHVGADGNLRIFSPEGRQVAQFDIRVGPLVWPIVARLKAGEPPCLLFFDADGKLQCYLTPRPPSLPARTSLGKGEPEPKPSPFPVSAANAVGKGAGGLGPRWTQTGTGHWSYYIPNSQPRGIPFVADVDGDGEKEVLIAQKKRLVALGPDGKVKKAWTFAAPPMQWSIGYLDDDATPDLVVTLALGAILDVETVAVSGATGKTLWRVHCGNGPLAVYDLNGDGRDDVILRDLYERRTLEGSTGRDILPIVMVPGYHTPVVLAAFGAARSGLLWIGGGWCLTAEDSQGTQMWRTWMVPTGPQGVADVDGDGKLEVGGVSAGQVYQLPELKPLNSPDREFVCYDTTTGEKKWAHPIGASGSAVVTADVDGDGQPEFLLGTADGRLIALRGGDDPQKRVLWEVTLPAALGPPVVCDLDGDGALSILVSCADGNLYCLR